MAVHPRNVLGFLLTIATALVWIGASLALLMNGGAESFQRFGSLGVLLSITIVALVRENARSVIVQREAEIATVVLASLGTAQWGYGDLFHRWWNGCQGVTC